MSTETQDLLSLSLPKNNFIADYSTAESIVNSAIESHGNYWELIKACQKHISGEKPIPSDELKKKGMGWAWNFNFGKARAKIEKGVAESAAKVSSALALGYVTFRNVKEEDKSDEVLSFLQDDNKRGIVASAIGYSFTSALAKETRLSSWLNDVEYPSFAFGWCALSFDKFDWMPDHIHPLNIAFKPNTRPEKIDEWVIFDTLTAKELYEKWVDARNESVSGQIASSGWVLDALEDLLLKAYRGSKDKDGSKITEWEQLIPDYQSNPAGFITSTSDVGIAKIYYKELDGTISETYIPWANAWQVTTNREGANKSQQVDGNKIIFSKNRGKYIQREHIALVRDSGFSSDAGCIQDYRGLAKFAVEDSIRYNRLRNGIGNKMQFVGSPMFEQSNSQTAEKFKVTVSQGFVIVPSSHNLIEKQPAFDIASHINVLRFEENEYNRDTQQYDASIQGRLTSRPNKGEVQQIASEVQFTESAKNNIKFRDYSALFHTVLSRMPSVDCNESDVGYEGKERFYETVKKQLGWLVKDNSDVDKILESIDSFVMDPIITSIETITIAMQMAETPFARNRLKRMMLIAKGLPIEEVNLAVPLIIDKFSNMQDARIAAFENDMFFTTNEIVLSGTDDDIVHIDSHFSKCQRVIQGTNDQALAPSVAFKYLENCLAHSLSHIEKLGSQPILNDKAKEYMVQFKQMVQIKDQIKGIAEKMMQAEQEKAQQMQLDPATEAEIADRNARSVSDLQRKDWIAQQRAEQRDKQITLSHEAQLRKIELEAELKKLELGNE